MLVVSEEQLDRVGALMLERFEQRLLRHVEEYFPTHWRTAGLEQIGQLVRSGIARARVGGFRSERDAYIYVSLMLYLGSAFDDDPQYRSITAALNDDMIREPSTRLAMVFESAMAFFDTAAGPRREHMSAALRRAQATTLAELARTPQVNYEYVRGTLAWIWPQKYELIGEPAVRELCESVVPRSRSAGVATPAGALLYTVIAFLFGHGIHHDPQLPWVGKTLAAGDLDAPSKVQALQHAFALHLAAVTG